MRWLDVIAASDRLDYARDRDQLRALVRADKAGTLTTWPLALVRHAHAVGRGSWADDDQQRPLDATGQQRADGIAPLLAAYGVRRLVSSPSLRCADTLRPYAAQLGASLRTKDGLSEEGYAAEPARAAHHLGRLVERGTPAALCSHGPVLPELLMALLALVDPDEPEADLAAASLRAAARDKMAKGEVLVAHLVGTGVDGAAGRRRAPPAALLTATADQSFTRCIPRGRCADVECLTGVHRAVHPPRATASLALPTFGSSGTARPPLISP